MGLLGFFSRRQQQPLAPIGDGLDALKAQPYKATVASQPPTQGTTPVAGNGPNILETLQKTHPKFKTGNISFGAHSSASAVSLGRAEKADRPRTAPSQDSQTWAGRPRSGSWKAHPVPLLPSVPSVKSRPPYRLTDKDPGTVVARESKQRQSFRLPDQPADIDKPLPPFSRERSASIHSSRSGTATAYVDLLDAQAGINPTDFRQRIQATGARDYGEDVADRNIRENGVSMPSVDARALYATSNNSSRPSSFAQHSREEQGGEEFDLKFKKRHSLGSSLRSKSLTSDAAAVRPRSNPRQTAVETKGRIRVENVTNKSVYASKSKKSEWRKSLPSYVSSSRRKDEEDERAEFPDSLKAKSTAAAAMTSKTMGGLSNGTTATAQPRVLHGNESTSRTDAGGNFDGDINAHTSNEEPLSKESKAERRRTMTYTSNPQADQAPSKRLSLQNLQFLSTNDVFRIKPKSPTFETYEFRRNRGSTAGSEDAPSAAEFQMKAFSSPPPKQSSKRPTGRHRLAVEDIPRTRSPLTRINPDEIPDRTSSMRHWSMDSTSATSLSSNPFRPQSRHTANTSIDLSPFPKEANFSRDSLSAGSYRAPSRENRLQTPPSIKAMPSPPKPSHRPQASTTFNIDDYISSDDDLDSPRVSRGVGEEHLLFKDSGFAFSGFGLPGLNGSIDSGAPRFIPASPPRFIVQSHGAYEAYDHDDFLMSKYKASLAGAKQDVQHRTLRHDMPAYDFGDSDSSEAEDPLHKLQDEDSDDSISFDIPVSRRPRQQSYRQYRYTSREQAIEEEKEFDKVDLTTAMRLRKEEKRKKRLSGSTIRPRSNSGKGKEVLRPHNFDVAGFDADIE